MDTFSTRSQCSRKLRIFDFKNGRGGDQSLFVHREIFEKVNGYNNNLLITEKSVEALEAVYTSKKD